jgi:hypothetical protein
MAGTLIAVTLFVRYNPARRASRVDPQLHYGSSKSTLNR